MDKYLSETPWTPCGGSGCRGVDPGAAAVSGGGNGDRDDERHVRFGDALVREFDRCIDWHPCISSGVPIGLDWGFKDWPAVRGVRTRLVVLMPALSLSHAFNHNKRKTWRRTRNGDRFVVSNVSLILGLGGSSQGGRRINHWAIFFHA